MIKNELGVCSAAVITDDTVNSLYADEVIASLENAGFRTFKFVFPHGEEYFRKKTEIIKEVSKEKVAERIEAIFT